MKSKLKIIHMIKPAKEAILNIKTAVLKNKTVYVPATVMAITAVAGLLLITAPARERNGLMTAQYALMEEIISNMPRHEESVPFEPASIARLPFFEPQCELSCPDETYSRHVWQEAQHAVTNRPATLDGIGVLTIERIDLKLPVVEGVDEESLRIAVGRVPQTPPIGTIGNAVIAGHRNYTHGQMFNRLGELAIDDIIHYRCKGGKTMQFSVFEIAVIEPGDQITFIQPLYYSIITLYTCTPVRIASHRLIIRAKKFT